MSEDRRFHAPEPIEPTGSSRLAEEANDLLDEVENLSQVGRVCGSIVMLIVATACLWGAYAITAEFRHWVAWAFAVVLLEPVGLAAAFAAVFLVAPNSSLGRWFAGSLRRAKIGLLVTLFAFLGSILALVAWGASELWTLRR
jgi:hypothetical protein